MPVTCARAKQGGTGLAMGALLKRLNLPVSPLTQPLKQGVERTYYSQGGFDVGRGMGLCGWSEADQIVLRLHDVPALLLFL